MPELDGYGANLWEKQLGTVEYLIQSGIVRRRLICESYVRGFHEVATPVA